MKKWVMILMVLAVMGLAAGSSNAGNGPSGSAPNSGDGISDGSGFDFPFGPFGGN